MSDAGELLAAAARGVVGWTCPDPRYLALVAPAEVAVGDDAAALAIAKLSDCALVAHGILDLVLDLPARGVYVTGRALADVVALARDADAYEQPVEALPELGDVLHFGPSPGLPTRDPRTGVSRPAYPEHMDMVERIDPLVSSLLMLSRIAGGERDAAQRETITIGDKPVLWTAQRVIEVRTGRPLLAIIRGEKLAARWGLRS